MTIDNLHLPFEAWRAANPIDSDHCFLCWSELTNENRTDEHVFPKWMQDRFSLFNQPLTLPNKTWIPYRMIRIPCCGKCNNEALSRLEQKMSGAIQVGFDEFTDLISKKELFLWLQCLFYKTLYKDMSLLVDRSDRGPKIVSPEDLATLRLSHAFLRAIDCSVHFDGFLPASIFLVRTKTSSDAALNFDYVDSIPHSCLAIRMNDVGIIASLRDGGLQEALMGEQMQQDLLDHEFNPVQFRNLFAKVLYQQSRIKDPFKYGITAGDPKSLEISREMMSQNEFGGDHVFGPEDSDLHAQITAGVLGTTVEAIKLPDGSVGSLFYDLEGNWKDRPFEDEGWKPNSVAVES